MRRGSTLLLLVPIACSTATPVGERIGGAPSGPASALLVQLVDTTSATRVYLPREVAQPATIVDELAEVAAVLQTADRSAMRVAGVRGIIDTLGKVERATLTVLPGSDPREASILQRRFARARWRPARLATGQAVRQLFDWRICINAGGTCAHVGNTAIERDVPRVVNP